MADDRRLVAVLACRNDGTRLYGKPLQRVGADTTILAQIVASLRALPEVADIVLAVAEGPANTVFADVAAELGVRHIVGSHDDVLGRVITAAATSAATDVLRKTTEDPFAHWAALPEAWERHGDNGNDATALGGLPEGTGFEIYRLDSLERAHDEGDHADREHIATWFRNRRDSLGVEVMAPPSELARSDLRLTVDNPEDLVVCRAVYRALEDLAPLIPLDRIVAFLDGRPDLTRLVAPFVDECPFWTA